MLQTQPDRTRTFSWADPQITAVRVGAGSGMDLLRALLAGELPAPPIFQLLDFGKMTVEEGRVVVELTPQEFHYNPIGSVHGGVIAALLDTAAGCAVHSTLPAGVAYTTLDLNTRYLRPVTVQSGLLRCEGVVLSRGRRVALAEARLTDAGGRLVAHATSSCLLFESAPPAT